MTAYVEMDMDVMARFSRLDREGTPEVLRACGPQEALRLWSYEYLNSFPEAASALVTVQVSPTSRFYGDDRSPGSVRLPFSSLVSAAAAASSASLQVLVCRSLGLDPTTSPVELYLCQSPIHKQAAKVSDLHAPHSQPPLNFLEKDLDLPLFGCRASSFESVSLWLGISETHGNLHYDDQHNLLCVIQGEKKVTLFSPRETIHLFPSPVHLSSANHSQVLLDRATGALPLELLNSVKSSVVTLHAGDVLFIPEGWWHQVSSSPSCIAVNYWWSGPSSTLFACDALSSMVTRRADMSTYYARRAAQVALAELMEERKRELASPDSCPEAVTVTAMLRGSAVAEDLGRLLIGPGTHGAEILKRAMARAPSLVLLKALLFAHSFDAAGLHSALSEIDGESADVLTSRLDEVYTKSNEKTEEEEEPKTRAVTKEAESDVELAATVYAMIFAEQAGGEGGVHLAALLEERRLAWKTAVAQAFLTKLLF